MKYIGLFLVLASTALFAASNRFPQGSFEGKGYWKMPSGQTGEYAAILKITGNEVYSKVDLGNGEIHEETGTVNFDENGFYNMTHGESQEPVATGYCGSVWCHAEGVSPEGAFEETIVFKDNQIFRLGSMKLQDVGMIMYEDALSPVAKR
ncbi:MAG: hypothetical protein KDD51_09835 [Bdellovibrionales bacterium]|nr:hypothetical protein [Bdellovibrionales bacterium]